MANHRGARARGANNHIVRLEHPAEVFGHASRIAAVTSVEVGLTATRLVRWVFRSKPDMLKDARRGDPNGGIEAVDKTRNEKTESHVRVFPMWPMEVKRAVAPRLRPSHHTLDIDEATVYIARVRCERVRLGADAVGVVAKRLGNGLQNHHTWVRIPSTPQGQPATGVTPVDTTSFDLHLRATRSNSRPDPP